MAVCFHSSRRFSTYTSRLLSSADPSFPRNFYQILGVSPQATQKEIKAAYYTQTAKYHPDKNPGKPSASQEFSQVTEAYGTLSKRHLRHRYDRRMGFAQGGWSPGMTQQGVRPNSSSAASTASAAFHNPNKSNLHYDSSKFNYDAFYQEHYGKVLEKDRLRKKRREAQQKRDKNNNTSNIDAGVYLLCGAVLVVFSFVIRGRV
eukprot:m.23587 g.23587  ORF g.23587 m.23587 type:complete len:203 (+) comp13193_c0_seq1:56-664(+)